MSAGMSIAPDNPTDRSGQAFPRPYSSDMRQGNDRNYEVFISHPGPLKHSLACTLEDKLTRAGIRTFLDREALELGDAADSKMEAAVCTSRIILFGLTEDFFTRKWTLQELHWALHSHADTGASIIPIFYGITTDQKGNLMQKMRAWMEEKKLDDLGQCTTDVDRLFRFTGKEYDTKHG